MELEKDKDGKKRRIDDPPVEAVGESVDSDNFSPPSVPASSKVSCLECRASKTKCSGGDVCQRCQRLARECVYKEHRRGRFSDSKKVQYLEDTVQALMKELKEARAAHGGSTPSVGSSTHHTSSMAESSSNWRIGGGSGDSSSNEKGQKGESGIYSRRSEAQNPSRLDQIPPKKDYELPMLSQPLELLAHASIQVRENQSNSSADASPFNNHPSQKGKQAVAGPARGEAFFSSGLCDNKEDHFDPIEKGVLSQQKAVRLFNVFMDKLNDSLLLLDPSLHSFGFVRGSSSMLLTSICWLAALFDSQASNLAKSLNNHLSKIILPAIYMESYRSVEIAQAFLLLAFYHPPSKTLSEDKSWQYIGHAARISSELGMNRLSNISPQRQQNEDFMRRVRNRERTWMNIWLGEMSLSEHMGRSPLLKMDPVISSCSHWHSRAFAAASDSTIICFIQLRLLVTRQSETFDRMVLAAQSTENNDPQKNEAYSTMIQFYFRSSAVALDSWLWTWSQWNSTGGSNSVQRLDKAKLYYWYARILLITKAISLTDQLHNHKDVINGFYTDAFGSAITYMNLFMSTQIPENLIWGHNPTVVTPTYCCIFCIHVIMAFDQAQSRFGIDVEATFSLIRQFIAALEMAGSVTEHRNGAATTYGPFLSSVWSKATEKRNRELQRDRSQSHNEVPQFQSPYQSHHNYSFPSTPNQYYQGGESQQPMGPPPGMVMNEMPNRSGLTPIEYQNVGVNSNNMINISNEIGQESIWLPGFFNKASTEIPHSAPSTDMLDEAGLNSLIFGNHFQY